MHILITINSCSITPSCNPHQALVQKLGNRLVPKCLQIQSGKKHTKQDFATHKKTHTGLRDFQIKLMLSAPDYPLLPPGIPLSSH